MKFWKPPTGYEYWTDEFKTSVTRIWIRNVSREFIYGDEKHPSSVWGFYNKKKDEFLSPINWKKPGKKIELNDTSPYTAMRKNYNPLEALLYGNS